MDRRLRAVGLALLAAVLYAVNLPFSKLLLGQVGSLTLAGLLYLGAGAGMALLSLFHRDDAPRLGREDLAPTLGMILLDIAAPILLMLGLRGGEAASASLLGNFEIVATALFALLLFRERVSRTLWAALGCITLSCGILSFQGAESLRFSAASLLVLGAARTSAYYSVNPFVGSLLALLLLREGLGPGYFAALPVMLLGVGLATADTLAQERGASHPGGEAGD